MSTKIEQIYGSGIKDALKATQQVREFYRSGMVETLDSMQRINEQIYGSGIRDTLKAAQQVREFYRSGMVEALDSMQRMNEQIYGSGIRGALKAAKQVCEIYRSGIVESLSSIQKMSEQIYGSGIKDALRAAQQVREIYRSGIVEALGSIQKMNGQIYGLGIRDAFRSVQDTIDFTKICVDKIDEVTECLGSTEYQVEVSGNGTISISNETHDIEEINSIVRSYLEECGFTSKIESYETLINSLIKKINGLTLKNKINVIISTILLGIIANILFAFISPSIEPIVKSIYGNSEKAIIRTMKKEVSQNVIDKSVLKEYRFVTISCLNVRSGDTINSPVIGRLYLGQVVKVINKNRSWTLIEYENKDSQVYIKGWVFTRYISIFK